VSTIDSPRNTIKERERPGAIVLGGNFVGLGVARSLGAQGIPVWVYDTDASKCIAQYSRFTKRFVASTDDIHQLLLRDGQEHGLHGWVVFAVNDEFVETLAVHRDSLETIYRIASPPLDKARIALDKRLTYQKAQEFGIAAPWTLVTDDPANAAKELPYPVVLKPAVNHHFFPHTNVKAILASTPAEFVTAFGQMRKYIPADEILIQERIPGGGEAQFSFCAVCRDGDPYATLVARRSRQYPIDFGNASSFVETVSQPVVESAGKKFLEGIGFDGTAEIEFKFDARDGQYKILDFNPRPWGWNTLGKAAGIDFVHLLYQQKVGLPISPVKAPRPASWLREITDPLSILKSPRPAAQSLKTLGALARGRVTLATFSVTDPIPFFAEFVLWAMKGARRQKQAKEFEAEALRAEGKG